MSQYRPTPNPFLPQAPVPQGGAGLQYRPLSPGRAALGGGLSGLGALLLALGSGNRQAAGQAFQGGLAGFEDQQARRAEQARNDELFGFQKTQFESEQSRAAADDARQAEQKRASDAAIDQLVASGAIKPEVGDLLKATGQTPGYGDLVPKASMDAPTVKDFFEGGQTIQK